MNPIRQNCGAQAWQVIFRVLRDTTNTLMPACQFLEKPTINSEEEKLLYIEANPQTTSLNNNQSQGTKISAEWLYPKTENSVERSKNFSQNFHKIRGSENRRSGSENHLENYENSPSSFSNAQVSDIRIGFEENDPNSGIISNPSNSIVYFFIIIALLTFL